MLDQDLASRIRLVGFDVDGVLTDNGLYLGMLEGRPLELKRFHIQDGLGIKLLQLAGLRVALVSGRPSAATEARARELGLDAVVQDGAARKVPLFHDLLRRYGFAWDQAAFVGDDLADLPVLRRVALPIAVANAVPDVLAAARYVTSAPGGAGAAREVADLLLKARGDWHAVLETYFAERGDDAARSGHVR